MFKQVVWWLLCLSAVVMWMVMPVSLGLIESYETRELALMTLPVVGVASLVFSISLMLALYQGWKSLVQSAPEDEDAPFRQMRSGAIDPTQAVAYLFVPLFNIYWQFVAFAGWCTQARLQQTATDAGSIPPRGVAIFAIVTSWLASILILVLPSFGYALGLASTAAYLIVVHAMLTWRQPPLAPARTRAMAYFGFVNHQIDARIVAGSIAVGMVTMVMASCLAFFLHPIFYPYLQDAERSLVTSVVRSAIYALLAVPLAVGLPAAAGRLLDIRSPWLLVALVLPASVITAVLANIVFSLWDTSGLPRFDEAIASLAYCLIRTLAVAAVIGLLTFARSAALAIFSGITITFVLFKPFVDALAHATYMLTDPDAYASWSSIWWTFTDPTMATSTMLAQYALFGAGVVLVHTLFRSPLVTPESKHRQLS